MEKVEDCAVMPIEEIEVHEARTVAYLRVEQNRVARLLHRAGIEYLCPAKADPKGIAFSYIGTANYRPARVPDRHSGARQTWDSCPFELDLQV
jgi:hypothetical protein